MTRSGLLILFSLGILVLLLADRDTPMETQQSNMYFTCTGFSPIIASDTLYNCPEDTHLYTSDTSVNYLYQWNGPSGSISTDWHIMVSTKGIYGLTVTDTLNNCIATDSIFVLGTACEDLSSEFIPPGLDFTIYLDTIRPTFTPPNDTIIQVSGICVASTASAITGEVEDEADNCDVNLEVTYLDSIATMCTGSIRIYRRWTVADDCNNESFGEQIIEVMDSSAPIIIVPNDTTLFVASFCTLPDTSASNLGDYISVTDNCDHSSMFATYSDSIATLCTGAIRIIRTWVATDDCGNTGTASQTITINDNQGPIIYVPTDTIIAIGGTPRDATADDNCTTSPNLTYADSYSINGCYRELSRTWTAIDDCGNRTDSIQTIFIENGFNTLVTTSNYNGFEISCPGASNGVINVNPIGAAPPYTYTWSNGWTNAIAAGLDTGNYIIIVSDARGCNDTIDVNLIAPDSIEVLFAIDSLSCNDGNDASIDITVTGGVAPYTYIWSNGSTTRDLTNVVSGTYIVSITDNNGCFGLDSITVINTPAHEINLSITSDYGGQAVSCTGAQDASVLILTQNSIGNVSYLWSNGSSSNPLTNIAAGTYYVTATDENGCIDIDSITIIDNPGITTALTITSDYNGAHVSCADASDASANVMASGGISPYSYIWSNGSTTASINNVDTGQYMVTVTDDLGCQKVDSLNILFTNIPDIDISITSNYYGNAVSCNGSSDGSVSLNITNGIGPFTYNWSNGATTDTLIDILPGVYNLTLTDANGCETVDFIVVPNAPPLSLNINTTLVNCGASDGQIYATASDGSGDYEYSLDSISWQSNQLFSGLAPGMYMVYARDSNSGCASHSTEVNLISASAPDIENTTIINPTMSGNMDGAIMVTASGIGLDIEYQIDGLTPWQSSNLFDQLGEGTYNINARYRDQSCTSLVQAVLTAGNGITTMDSTSNVCSPEISNISNLGVYYIPIGEHEILEALQTITPLSCTDRYSVDPIENYIYIGVVESGTIITLDHWEDGFEPNYNFSIQPSTEIWGDGDPTNGLPPGFNIDYLNAGDKIFLDNAVVSTTRQSVIDYDAGDRISSLGDISITRLGWASGSSTLFAGAVEVHELNQWGQNYSIPVGQNTDVNEMFSYTGFSIMAANDNTVVRIDADANGISDLVITLNQGESYLHNGGVNSGGTIDADQPVQVHLITGDNCSRYESRWFTLTPEESWDMGYYVPVSTLNSGSTTTAFNNKPTYVHLYNPNATAIDVVYRTIDGIQDTIVVLSQSTAYQEIPEGTGAHFGSDANFYAIATIDSDSGMNIANDWGFALLPERQLSPQIYLTGFAPGQNPKYTCDMGITVPIAGYTPTASSEETTNVNGSVEHALDDDLSTAWYSAYSSGSTAHPHELVIDLGGEHNVTGFRHINALSTVSTSNYASTSLPALLPNNTRFDTTIAFVITDNFPILDLDVNLSITHSRITELTLILESPSGTQVTLFENGCNTARDIIATFDDDNGIPFDCSASDNGSAYLGLQQLSDFDAEYTAGVWTLHIDDNSGILGGGLLDAFSLDITHGTSAPGSIKDFEFYVSDDGLNWGIPLIEGSWNDSIPLHDERMPAIDARYVRFVSLSDFDNLGIASVGEFEVLYCGSSYSENSSPLWITAGHASGWADTLDINVCVDFNGDGGSITDPNGATYDSSYLLPPLGLLKIYDPDGDQTGIRVWVCDGSDGVISGAWGQDPATASAADPAIDLGVGLINSIPYSAQKCVELHNDFAGNDAYDKCDEVTYTITIKNTGALPLSTGTISIIDTLPAQLEYIAGTSRGVVDGITIMVEDDSLNTTIFPFDEGGTTIDTIILPGDSLLVRFEALIAYIDFGTFITNQAYANSGNNSFDPFISFPVQEPVFPLDSIVPADTLVSCESFVYPDTSIDTLSYLAIHDTILEDECLDAFTFQRIFVFTDNCHQEYTDTLQITVRDTTAPVILIPADTVISMNDLPFVITVPSSDNCATNIDLTFADDTTFNDCSFVIERVYTAEDNCSNISQETMNITVLYESNPWPVHITPSDIAPCHGEVVDLVSIIQNADGLTYTPRWFFRSDSTLSWSPLAGANQTNYSFTSSDISSGFYQVIYTQGGGTLDTNCIDHIGETYIEVLPMPSSGIIEQIICPGDSVDFYGRSISVAGLYQDTIQNIAGCDSIVQLDLLLYQEARSMVSDTICPGDPYLFGGALRSGPGVYYDTLATINGCDSIIELELLTRVPDRSILRDTMCFGNSYPFGGIPRSGSGTYYDTLANTYGCDSIVELWLYELPSISYAFDLAICPNDVFNFNGKSVDSTGTYQEILSSSTGCDSIITLNLVVRSIPTSVEPIALCFGDSVEINNIYIKSSGEYSEALSNQYGCDSIANYSVQVADQISMNEITRTICEGDSLWFDGVFLNQRGEYQEWTQSINGCDSTTILQLFVEPPVLLQSENIVICEGETAQLNVQGATEVQWSNTDGFSCETCPNPVLRPSTTQTYIASTASCSNTTATTEMTVTVNPIAHLTISRDTSILLGESALIEATTNDPNSIITWMHSVGDTICTNCLSTRVVPTQGSYYIAETYNDAGCIDRDSLHIETRDGCVEGQLTTPNFLTPNGDGENDVFTIEWAGIKSAELLNIYNRWGELIFTTSRVDEDFWDGKINEDFVNPGVYVYYVEYYCLNGNLQRRKGNVTVIK